MIVAVAAVAGFLGWWAGSDDSGGSASGPVTARSSAERDPSGEATSRKADPGKSSGKGKPGTSPASPSRSERADSSRPLKGKVVVIDPGHNLTNYQHTSEINKSVAVGNGSKECDTTGTATNAGYPEARFTLEVSRKLRDLLQAQGATVKLTQDGDLAWGPCVDERARIGNEAHADAVVSVHADGAPAGDRGFHVILPGPVRAGRADTSRILGPSEQLGTRIAHSFEQVTGSAPSNYVNNGAGVDVRTDLGGLNLSTVPKVFIECGNMRDSEDAALMTSTSWQKKAAQGLSEGIVAFLRG